MATIQQLWDANGRKPGLKIARVNYRKNTYFEVMDIRNKTVLGWMHLEGAKAKPPKICDGYAPDSYDWQVWQPPTHVEIKLYAAILKREDVNGGMRYFRSNELFEYEIDAKREFGESFVKMQKEPVATVTKELKPW